MVKKVKVRKRRREERRKERRMDNVEQASGKREERMKTGKKGKRQE